MLSKMLSIVDTAIGWVAGQGDAFKLLGKDLQNEHP